MHIDFSTATKALFENKELYKQFTKEDKEKNFFIINRYMAKKWPLMSQELNSKNLPKDICLDVWNGVIKQQKTPFWFWKSTKLEDKWPNGFKDKEVKFLMKHYNIDKQSILIILEHHKEEVKECLKYFEALEKETKD